MNPDFDFQIISRRIASPTVILVNPAMAAAATAAAAASADDPRTPHERGRGADESEEEEDEVESGDEGEGDDGDGPEVASLTDLCDPDAGSDEDPTFDPDADGDLEVEAVLRSRMRRLSISASARKAREGSAVPKMGKEEIDLLDKVDKLIKDGQLEKLKVYECKSYLRMHKLRLTGNKEVLLNRIREYIEVKNDGEGKYPVSSFVLNCKGDACKGDVVMFEQNIYRRKKGAPRDVKRLCGQRTNAGRIIKESYGTEKQQHTFTIEILWSKGYKPWPPLHQLLIKGRNLYKDKTVRQPWTDEEERKRVIQEKHARGDVARKSKALRIQKKEIEKKMRFNRVKENKSKEQQYMNQKPYKEAAAQVIVEPMANIYQRTDENKYPSIHSGEPGNTRHQHCLPLKATTTQHNGVLQENGATRTSKPGFIDHVPSIKNRGLQQQHLPLKVATTQHNEVLTQRGATTTSKQEFVNDEILSIQHGGLQQEIDPQPIHTQQMFKDQHQQPEYHSQNEVRQHKSAMMTSRKECIEHPVPSQRNGGSWNTKPHEISLKLTPQRISTPKYQEHNDWLPENDVRSYGREVLDYWNKSYHAASEPGNFTQHAKEHQHGSNSFQNGRADHQEGQPFRSRNLNFNSKENYDQEYYNQYNHGCRRTTGEQYHPHQRSQHQNNFKRWNTSQDQYHTHQKQYQNYNDHSRNRGDQKHHQQNQAQQLCNFYYTNGWCEFGDYCRYSHPCNFYYKNGWCRFGEKCRYSHDFY